MIKKWHRIILVEEIDFTKIPQELKDNVTRVTNKDKILSYEPLFEALGYSFDDVLNELDQVEEEGKKNYIYQLFIDTLPKKQEIKDIEKDMAKFDLWNYIASTLNPDHDAAAFEKELEEQYLSETLDDWKHEKVSRLVEVRERLEKERLKRKKELLERKKQKKLDAEEKEELEYIEEYDKYQDELKKMRIEELKQNGPAFTDDLMGDINLDGDFTDFNSPEIPEEELEALMNPEGEFKTEGMEEMNELQGSNKEEKLETTEIVEDERPNARRNKLKGKSSSSQTEKEVEKEVVKTIEIIKEVESPRTLQKLEEQRREIEQILQKSQAILNREADKFQQELTRKEEELLKAKEEFEKQSEEEKEIHSSEISEKEEEINELRDVLAQKIQEEEEFKSSQLALEEASAYEELRKASKKELKELCDRLTIQYTPMEAKTSLIEKLMIKSDRLKRRYNILDIEEEVEKRLEQSKEQMLTKEFAVDPFAGTNPSAGLDDPFSSGGGSDPFGNFQQSGGMDDMFGGGADPFGNVQMGSGMDDMFGGGSDPFGNVDVGGGMDDMFGGGSDPFGNVQMGGGMDDSFGTQDDPFGNMNMSGGSADDAFSGTSDPFANMNASAGHVDDVLSLEGGSRPAFESVTESQVSEFLDDDKSSFESQPNEQSIEKPLSKKDKKKLKKAKKKEAPVIEEKTNDFNDEW